MKKILFLSLCLSIIMGCTPSKKKEKINIKVVVKQPELAQKIMLLKNKADFDVRANQIKGEKGIFTYEESPDVFETGTIYLSRTLHTPIALSGKSFTIVVDTTATPKISFKGEGAKQQELFKAFANATKDLVPYADLKALNEPYQKIDLKLQNIKKTAHQIIKKTGKVDKSLQTWMETYVNAMIFNYKTFYGALYQNKEIRKRFESFDKTLKFNPQEIPNSFFLKENFNINAPMLSILTDDIEMFFSGLWSNINNLKDKKVIFKHISAKKAANLQKEERALSATFYANILLDIRNKKTYDALAYTSFMKYGQLNKEWENFISITKKNISNAKKRVAMQKKIDKLKEEEYQIENIKNLPVADFKCENISGEKVRLADFKGKFILLDIWATWCGPCKHEIPYLKKQEKAFKNKDIVFVSISLDKNKKTWKKFIHQQNMHGIQLIAGKEADKISKHYFVKGIPRFILLDKNGKVFDLNFLRPSDNNFKETLSSIISKKD